MKKDKAKNPPDCERSKNIKYSIRIQFSAIFIGVMVGVVMLCILVNNLFLSTYYIQAKNKILKNAYHDLIATASTDAYESSEFLQQMSLLTMTNNISIVIVDADSAVLYESMNGDRDLEFRLLGYILGRSDEMRESVVYESSDNYVIRRGRFAQNEFLEMFGRLDNGASFLMRVPMESIKESARYANRFFIYVGLFGTFLGAWIIYFITRQITGPIMELSDISERMVELDFEARYKGTETNEIGMLGANINKLSESLEESIRELKTANNELLRDIEKKEKNDEMRQEFLANVSHELKTPIALIQGYAEGLKEGINDDPESRDFYCDVIMDEASKMNKMVKQLLTLNQLEFGNEVVNLERFELTEMIRNYLQSARLLAEQDGIRVVFGDYPPTYVWGDEFKAEEVLTNFFSNAVHHCKEDSRKEKYIEVRLTPHDDVIRITVFNTGDPIPEESIERLWEKFYKVDKARTRAYGGSGVGLSIVKAIQESLNQGYGVENTEHGVVFWYELAAK